MELDTYQAFVQPSNCPTVELSASTVSDNEGLVGRVVAHQARLQRAARASCIGAMLLVLVALLEMQLSANVPAKAAGDGSSA